MTIVLIGVLQKFERHTKLNNKERILIIVAVLSLFFAGLDALVGLYSVSHQSSESAPTAEKQSLNNTQEPTHKIGNFYLRNGIVYVLGRVDYTDVILMGLDGNRFSSQVTVGNPRAITDVEFHLISERCAFTKIDSVTITIE